MSKILLIVCLILSVTVAESQSLEKEFPLSLTLEVTNPIDVAREHVMVIVPEEQIRKRNSDFNPNGFVVVDGEKEIASQFNRNDSQAKGIVFVLDKMYANEKRNVLIRYNPKANITREYTKRTQAELSHRTGGKWVNREYLDGEFKNVDFLQVPPEHKDHSWFIRYEGPGWESDKVGYRFYLDQRNATDVFGKKTSDMILQQVGQDGFDSYHNMQPWGMDVMKVGNSLGIGSIAVLQNGSAIRVEETDSVTCAIAENGPVYSSVVTDYYGWKHAAAKISLKSTLMIHAGSRLTHQVLNITGKADQLCTGIGKDKLATVSSSKGDKTRFGYLATYGKQSLNNDGLGVSVFFAPDDVIAFTEDAHSHIVNLRAVNGKVHYYFLAAWALEPGGIENEKQFKDYLNQVALELANPVRIKIK
ncbi:MAG TPA: DUF4861 domain-containing protein [Ohtaekwangia sp.]|nr:DUF4861 domain-containing protein [Ohtaekwangia sp.]